MRVAIAAAVAAAAGFAGPGAATTLCSPTVAGGTPDQQRVAQNVLCLMPGNALEAAYLVPAAARPGAIVVSVKLDSASVGSTLRDWEAYGRGRWEGEVAATAIHDAFARRGLGDVVGYNELGSPTATDTWRGFAPPPRTLGKGVGTWGYLDYRVKRIAREFHVAARAVLHAYNPYGKAPYVEISTADPRGYIASGALDAIADVFGFNAMAWGSGPVRYDGIFVELNGPEGVLQLSTVRPGGWSCGVYGRVPGGGDYCDLE